MINHMLTKLIIPWNVVDYVLLELRKSNPIFNYNDLVLNSHEPFWYCFLTQMVNYSVYFEAKPGKLSLLALSVVSLDKYIYKKCCQIMLQNWLCFITALHYIAPIYAIVACTLSVSFRDFILLWVRKVTVDSRTKGLMEACTPVIRPILD